MSADAFMTAATPLVADFVRNGRGQPMIVPAGGGKPVPYNRPSSWGKKLEDMYGINQWEKRCIAAGLARTPSLIARCLAIPMDPRDWSKADKDALNAIADEAKTAARANQAADIGTALHRMTERVDLGEDLGELPEPFAADIAAYTAGMKAHGIVTFDGYVECRLVCDDLKLAGTADRIVSHGPGLKIYDLKTGESIELAALGYAVQLAIYAHSSLYDVATGTRKATDANTAMALIGHLPAGKGEFRLHEVDIDAGWEAALLCADIDRWRKRKGLLVAVPTPAKQIAQPAGDSPVTTGDEPQAAPLIIHVDREITPDQATAFKATWDRVQNLRQRCRKIVELSPKGGEWLKGQMRDAGLTLNGTPLDAELNAIESLVQHAELRTNAPFNDLAPTLPTPNSGPIDQMRLHRGPIDEGVRLKPDEPAFVAMKAAYDQLDAASRSWLESIVQQSMVAGRSIHMGGGHTTLRRVRIVTGLATLALAEQDTTREAVA